MSARGVKPGGGHSRRVCSVLDGFVRHFELDRFSGTLRSDSICVPIQSCVTYTSLLSCNLKSALGVLAIFARWRSATSLTVHFLLHGFAQETG